MTSQLTRTYYYDGELLAKGDFIRDQQYVRDIIALQNQNLFTPGVVSGLGLSVQGSSINVATGLAFAKSGTPIAVLTTVSRSMAGVSAGTYNLWIDYSDTNKNNPNIQNLQATHTIIEQPLLSSLPTATPAPTQTAVIIGQATVDGSGAVTVSTSGRQTAQLIAPPPAPAAQTLAVTPEHTLAAPGGAEAVPALAVGQTLDGAATLGKAPLTVGLDYGAESSAQAVAAFGFKNGSNQAGTVTLGAAGPSGAYDLINVTYNGARVWSVDQTGAAFSVSDAALKVDVATIQDPLAVIGRMAGVAYSHAGLSTRRIGLMAQDVEAALPEAVHTDAQGMKAIAYNAVVGVLVEAVKALTARVEALEAAQSGPAKPPRPAKPRTP